MTGDTLGYVIDPDAYTASATWGGPNDTLAARDVALHLLPVGSGFDFSTMTPSQVGTPKLKPSIAGRTYPAFTTGAAAGRCSSRAGSSPIRRATSARRS